MPSRRISVFYTIDLVAISLFLMLAYLGLTLPFPQQPSDEWMHFSYALQLRDAHFMPPDLQQLMAYDFTTRLPTEHLNYLNHPATAYYALAWLLQQWQDASIPSLRLLCFLPACLAYGLYLRFGRSFATAPASYLAYSLLPSLLGFPITLANITPEPLIFLGGCCVFWGWHRFAAHASSWRWLLIAGLFLCSLKLNSLLLVGAYSAFYGWHAWREKRFRELLLPIIATLLFTLPYLALWAQWGSPVPNTPGQLHLLAQGPGMLRGHPQFQPDSFVSYAVFALRSFPYAHGDALYWFFAAPLTVLFFGLMRQWLRPTCFPAHATAWAWLAVFVIHLLFSYQRYVTYHWPLDFYPRYYMALLPGLGILLVDTLHGIRGPGRTNG